MYHLFAGQGYYPMSGLGDYQGPYETLEEAVAEGKRLTKKPETGRTWGEQDWYSVITQHEEGRLIEVSAGYTWE